MTNGRTASSPSGAGSPGVPVVTAPPASPASDLPPTFEQSLQRLLESHRETREPTLSGIGAAIALRLGTIETALVTIANAAVKAPPAAGGGTGSTSAPTGGTGTHTTGHGEGTHAAHDHERLTRLEEHVRVLSEQKRELEDCLAKLIRTVEEQGERIRHLENPKRK